MIAGWYVSIPLRHTPAGNMSGLDHSGVECPWAQDNQPLCIEIKEVGWARGLQGSRETLHGVEIANPAGT